jgi:hypothetical protein
MSTPNPQQGRPIAGHWFFGPVPLVLAPQSFAGWRGIYAIGSTDSVGGRWLDVGESDDVGDRIVRHDRKSCWLANVTGPMVVFAHIEPNPILRREKERYIRSVLNPVCGEH